jgi:hypothetical protein
MRTNTQEAVLSAYIASIGKSTLRNTWSRRLGGIRVSPCLPRAEMLVSVTEDMI